MVYGSDLERQGAAFISRFLVSGERERKAARSEGTALAEQLQHAAMDLAYSKATEFSPLIRRYHLLAAKVALLVHWPDLEALRMFERDILYYRNFESTQWLVDEYQQFREAYTGTARDGQGDRK